MGTHSNRLRIYMKILTNIGMHAGLTCIEGCTDSNFESDKGMQEGVSSPVIMSGQSFPAPIVTLNDEIEEK